MYQIRRCDSGELGGWVESEKNLSQEGTCWIDTDSKVLSDAEVNCNAIIMNGSVVTDHAFVTG